MKTLILLLFLLSQLMAQPLFIEQVSGVNTGLNYVVPTGWSGSNVVAVWVCGDNGVVLKTTSSGGGWQIASIPSTMNLNTLGYNRDNSIMALVAGVRNDTAIVYRTTNAGTNWSIVFRQYQGNINAIYFTNTTGIMIGNPVGSRWSIFRISNQGTTFDSAGMYLPRNGSEIGYRNSFNMYNGTTFTIFGTNNPRAYYSTNFGTSWSVLAVPSLPAVTSIHIISAGPLGATGYFGGLQNIAFTSNGGVNWIYSVNAPGAGTISSILACPVPVAQFGWHDVFITKGDNNLYRIPSNTWMIGYTAPAGNYRYISNQMYGWYTYAVRDNGGISWGSCGTGGITRISENVPMQFSLSQNYPNPFNPSTSIEFDVPSNTSVRLSIFDAIGREIARPVERALVPGRYLYEWDASNYPSGVYFYSLLAGNYSETRKMILMK